MVRLELYGNIDEKGVLIIHNRKRLEQWAKEYPGKGVVIKIDKKFSKRSDPQNRYYWGIVIKEISIRLRELGHNWLSDNDVHEMMKMKFNHKDAISKEGEVLEIPMSTANLNKTEFGEYVDKVRQWASDFLDIYIPEPTAKNIMSF